MVKDIYDLSRTNYDFGQSSVGQKFKYDEYQSIADDDTEFTTKFLLPEDPISDQVVLLAYGMGANSFFHEREAEAIAERGYKVALHDEPRYQKRMTLLDVFSGRRSFESFMAHSFNPMIFASQALSGVIETARDNYATDKFIVKGHSKGGLTAAMIGAREADVSSIVLDSPAGVVTKNALLNHMTKTYEMMTDEVMPMASALSNSDRPGTYERALRNMTDDPMRVGREMLALIARTPDIRSLLAQAKSHGTKVAVIGHEYDRFFSIHDLDKDVPQMMRDGYVDEYVRVQGTKHVNPGIDPEFSARIFDTTIRNLDN